MGSLTYDPSEPLSFEIEGYGTFWLKPKVWEGLDPNDPEDAEVLEVLGEAFTLHGSDWDENDILGNVMCSKSKEPIAVSGEDILGDGVEREFCEAGAEAKKANFTGGEKLLVTAAMIIFNTV